MAFLMSPKVYSSLLLTMDWFAFVFKHRQVTDYTDVKSSALFGLLKEFTQCLERIGNRYSALCKRSSKTPEEIHAISQLNAVREMVQKTFYAMSFYDKGKVPSMPEILGLLGSVKHLLDYDKLFLLRETALIKQVELLLPDLIKNAKQEVEDAKNEPLCFIDVLKQKIKENTDALGKKIHHFPGLPIEQFITELMVILDSLSQGVHLSHSTSLKDQIVVLLRDRLLGELDSYGLIIAHPMSYELSLALLDLLRKLPDSFNQLVSFLNPKALVKDFSSGVSGLIVGVYIPGGFKFELSEEGEYCYWVTIGQSKIKIDFVREYQEKKNSLMRQLMQQLYKYYLCYQETSHLKSEQAKFELCHQLVHAELSKINLTLQRYLDEFTTSHFEFSEKKQVFEVDDLLKKLDCLFQAGLKLIECFEKQKQGLSVLPLKNWLMSHHVMQSALEEHTHKGFDLSYLSEPLPHYLLDLFKTHHANPEVCEMRNKVSEQLVLAIQIIHSRLQKMPIYRETLNKAFESGLSYWQDEQFLLIQTQARHGEQRCLQLTSNFQEIDAGILSLPPSISPQFSNYLGQLNRLYVEIETLSTEINALYSIDYRGLVWPEKEAFDKKIKEVVNEVARRIFFLGQDVKNKAMALQDRMEQIAMNDKVSQSEATLSEAIPNTIDQKKEEIKKQMISCQTQILECSETLHLKRNRVKEKKAVLDSLEQVKNKLMNNDSVLQNQRQAYIAKIIALESEYLGEITPNMPNDVALFLQEKQSTFDALFNQLTQSRHEAMQKINAKVMQDVLALKKEYQGIQEAYNEMVIAIRVIQNDMETVKKQQEIFSIEKSILEKEVNEDKKKLKALFALKRNQKFQSHWLERLKQVFFSYQGLHPEIKKQVMDQSMHNEEQILSETILLANRLDECKKHLTSLQKDLPLHFSGDIHPLQCLKKHTEEAMNALITHRLGQFIKQKQADLLALQSSVVVFQNQMEALIPSALNEANILSKIAFINELDVFFKQSQSVFAGIDGVFHNDSLLSYDKFQALHNTFTEVKNNTESSLQRYQKIVYSSIDALFEEMMLCLNQVILYREDSQDYYHTRQGLYNKLLQWFDLLSDQLKFESEKREQLKVGLFVIKTSQTLLLNQIKARERVAHEYQNKIDQYLKERAQKYSIKDYLFKKDKSKREKQLNEVKLRLAHYVFSGDRSALVTQLKQMKKESSGVHFTVLMSNLQIGLFKPNASANADGITVDPLQVTEILTQLMKNHPHHVMQAQRVLESINQLLSYGEQLKRNASQIGEIVSDLACQLKTELYQFIYRHQETLPNLEERQAFYDRFISQLHSRDDIMSQHQAAWKPLLLNLLIAIATLCLAPIIRLAYSKKTEGTFSFFYCKTKREQLVSDIDAEINRLSFY